MPWEKEAFHWDQEIPFRLTVLLNIQTLVKTTKNQKKLVKKIVHQAKSNARKVICVQLKDKSN